MILKPHQVKRRPALAVKTVGEREICCDNAAGKAEYARRRRKLAWERDHGICGWCETSVPFDAATTDHIIPRGMSSSSKFGSRRDDRLSKIRAVHGSCNFERGSSRILTRAEWLKAKKHEVAA